MLKLASIYHPNIPHDIARDEGAQLIRALAAKWQFQYDLVKVGRDWVVQTPVFDTMSNETRNAMQAFSEGFLASRHLWER